MPRKLYVNLPVKDRERSVDFFAALGFSFNPTFTNENAAAMIVNDLTGVMLLQEGFFSTFTPKAICDAKEAVEALLAISLDSRAADQVSGAPLRSGISSAVAMMSIT